MTPNGYSKTGFYLSLLFHFSAVLMLLIFSAPQSDFSFPAAKGNETEFPVYAGGVNPLETGEDKSDIVASKEKQDDEKKPAEETKMVTNESNSVSEDVVGTEFKKGVEGADTNVATQTFSEKTLNVKIRYPSGWEIQNQNRKQKLDAVVFMNPDAKNKYAPYIILEVKKKDYFNPKKFKHKQELRYYSILFNEPEEMEGQVTFTVYIRTKTEEDYTLKLRINGMDGFAEYKPTFFAMLKSFRFGSFWDLF